MELLAPAGDFEKLEIAVHYGADAVYLSGKDFSLRNFSGNFTVDEIRDAVHFAHSKGVKVYVACNIFPKNEEIRPISDFLEISGRFNPDAVIIADPGIIRLARSIIPHIPIHLSTQANTTNIESALFWQDAGVKRINIARELSLTEIREIVSATDMEIEAFVHGAMCMAVSGRCLLSSFMTGRSGNRGMCAHPCRWRYAVVEETRPGQYMPVAEDDRGTYIFSPRDLCMIESLPDLIKSGVASLKIEGRMKGIHYLASVVNVYRQAIDTCYDDPQSYRVKEEWVQALSGVNSRGFSTGFFFGDPNRVLPGYTRDARFREHLFLGKIIKPSGDRYLVDVRNKFETSDAVDILRRNETPSQDIILEIKDPYGLPITTAKPGDRVTVALKHRYGKNDVIRKRHKTEKEHEIDSRSRQPDHHQQQD